MYDAAVGLQLKKMPKKLPRRRWLAAVVALATFRGGAPCGHNTRFHEKSGRHVPLPTCFGHHMPDNITLREDRLCGLDATEGPCRQCEGPCTTDSDCRGKDLRCFSHVSFHGTGLVSISVPGCHTSPDDASHWRELRRRSFCFDPRENGACSLPATQSSIRYIHGYVDELCEYAQGRRSRCENGAWVDIGSTRCTSPGTNFATAWLLVAAALCLLASARTWCVRRQLRQVENEIALMRVRPVPEPSICGDDLCQAAPVIVVDGEILPKREENPLSLASHDAEVCLCMSLPTTLRSSNSTLF